MDQIDSNLISVRGLISDGIQVTLREYHWMLALQNGKEIQLQIDSMGNWILPWETTNHAGFQVQRYPAHSTQQAAFDAFVAFSVKKGHMILPSSDSSGIPT